MTVLEILEGQRVSLLSSLVFPLNMYLSPWPAHPTSRGKLEQAGCLGLPSAQPSVNGLRLPHPTADLH